MICARRLHLLPELTPETPHQSQAAGKCISTMCSAPCWRFPCASRRANEWVNEFLAGKGLSLPGFLTAMMAGIVITNVADTVKKPLNRIAIERAGELSLQLFLAMSLMSMDLMSLMDSMGKILFMVTAQVIVVVAVAVFVVFRVTGRNYDSAIMASGFCGLGLGATLVAIANMTALTTKFGPSIQALPAMESEAKAGRPQ